MWGYKMEAFDGTAYNAAAMVKAGIRTAVNSDSDELARRLYGEAAKSMKYGGLSETQALRLITIDPAWMLGVPPRQLWPNMQLKTPRNSAVLLN